MPNEISADADFLRVWEHLRAVRRLENRARFEDTTTGLTLMGLAAELRGRANALVTEGANLQMLEILEWEDEDVAAELGATSCPPPQVRRG